MTETESADDVAPEVDHDIDVANAVRIGIDIVLTLLCIYVMWGYVKERPEIQSAEAKVAAWWHEATTRQKRMKKMENETVFEAIRVVDDAGN